MLTPFHETLGVGSMFGEGAKKLLGAPDLSVYEVLVRECVQNSWDARLPGATPRFRFSVERLREETRRALFDDVFASNDGVTREIRDELNRAGHDWVVEIDDRGTSGLDGITNPKLAVPAHAATNFRDLIYVIGASRDTDFGGGTYGFGKTATYLASNINTIIYWTRCRVDGGFDYRLIVNRMGDKFDHAGIAHTGRSWWGGVAQDQDCPPIMGEEAKRLGERLFSRGFDGDETGTSILVLSPLQSSRIDDDIERNPVEEKLLIAEEARDAVLLNLWPKITPWPGQDRSPMSISVEFDGTELELGSPSRGAWRIWAEALNAARTGEAHEDSLPASYAFDVRYQRSARGSGGIRELGKLGFAKGIATEPLEPFDRVLADKSGYVCRMRDVELVVDYEPIAGAKELPWANLAGVFKVLEDHRVDEAFAKAESPTHSSWQVHQLTGVEKAIVTFALNKVVEISKQFVESFQTHHLDEESQRNEKIGQRLNSLRPRARKIEEAKPARARRGRKRKIYKPTIEAIDFVPLPNSKYQLQEVTLRFPEGDRAIPVTLHVMLQGDAQAFAIPDHDLRCVWFDSDGSKVAEGTTVKAAPGNTYKIRLQCPAGYALNIDVREAAA